MPKKNKTIAGYHLLMILSAIDNHFHVNEDLVIRDFLIEEYPNPIPINLDKAMEELSNLRKEDYLSHYFKMLKNFGEESTYSERLSLFDFAVNLIKADHKITPEENEYIRHMALEWKLASKK